jgi:Rad52/22 family double-strand break repair protein
MVTQATAAHVTLSDGEQIGPHGLTYRQYRALLAALDEARRCTLEERGKRPQSYLETWDVEAHLTRIFGFGGWDDELRETTLIFERSHQRHNNGQPVVRDGEPVLRWYVAYRATIQLTVRNIFGEVIKTVSGVATGQADNQPDQAGAHDLALKAAASGALKRAATKLGDQFGLSLYNNGSLGPTVISTLVWTDPDQAASPDQAEQAAVVPIVRVTPGEDRQGTAEAEGDAAPVPAPPAAGGRRARQGQPAAAPGRRAAAARQGGPAAAAERDRQRRAPLRGDREWRRPLPNQVRRVGQLAEDAGVDDAGFQRFLAHHYGVEEAGNLHRPALESLIERLSSGSGPQEFKAAVDALPEPAPAAATASGS